jgi:transposase
MKQIYGIDLAKEKFDVCFINQEGKTVERVIKNKYSAIINFLSNLPSNACLCGENTGVYGELLVFLANMLKIEICLNSGYEIKHSLGLQKGKSDKLDARRIREYGERFADRLRPAKITSEAMTELKELHNLRAQFVRQRKMLSCHIDCKKLKPFNSIKADVLARKQLEHLKKCIEEVESEIFNVIKLDPSLFDNYLLITSIKGIGPVTTSELIVKTENFKKINSAKKAASFAGVCPFPNSTGKMVRKSKVSKMSDKALRSLLHLCGKTAVLNNMEFKLYFERKKAEGKPYYLIMNNVVYS